jgi:hypothetical protein
MRWISRAISVVGSAAQVAVPAIDAAKGADRGRARRNRERVSSEGFG